VGDGEGGTGGGKFTAEWTVETMVWRRRASVGRRAYREGKIRVRSAWAVAPPRRRVRRVRHCLMN